MMRADIHLKPETILFWSSSHNKKLQFNNLKFALYVSGQTPTRLYIFRAHGENRFPPEVQLQHTTTRRKKIDTLHFIHHLKDNKHAISEKLTTET